MDKYKYNPEFRYKIIALCLDRAWFARYGTSVVLPAFFDGSDEQDIVAAVIEHFHKYKTVPSDVAEMLVLCPEHEKLIRHVYSLKTAGDNSFVIDVVVQWAKEQAAKQAVLDSVDDIRQGDLSTVVQRMKAAIRVGEDLSLPGIDIVDDVSAWLNPAMFTSKVRTGWMHVDNYMDGGLGIGEELTVLAPSNRGKTMMLANIAYGAAGLGSGKNVVIFTHEMRQETYAKRFGARMVFRFPKKNDDLEMYEMEFTSQARKLLPGHIRIIGDGKRMSTTQIETSVDRMIAEGFKPDLIIDDYLDLVTSKRQYKDRRYELTDLWEWFRQFGNSLGVPVVTASQTTRGAYNKEIIELDDIAEDIGKVNTSDVIIALCQTKQEEEQKRCRLYMAKVRDGNRGGMFDAKFYGEQQAIITTGVSKKKDVREEKETSSRRGVARTG